jgi:outer membrane protein assembly factor BamB
MAAVLATALILLLPPFPSQAADAPFAWPQFGFDEQHSGVNPFETTITPSNVRSLKRLFRVPLINAASPSVADGEPVYLSGLDVGGTLKDVLFLTTKDGWTLALDAHTGAQLWAKQYGPASCLVAAGEQASQPCYTTSSPALDPSGHFVYSYGLDGYVHKYSVSTGVETHDTNWPELVTLKPAYEKETSALSVGTVASGRSYLYVATSGYLGDEGDYQGHVTSIELATGTQHVFNALCSDITDANQNGVHFALAPHTPQCPQTRAAIWGRPGVVHDPVTHRIYVATGNGTFDPARHYWGDSVLALNENGTGVRGNPVDSYTPTDQAVLNDTDADLGSTAPVLLPPIPGSIYPHLAIQGQKINRSTRAGELRLINLDNLSGTAAPGPGHVGGDVGPRFSMPQGGFMMTQPTVWVDPAHAHKPWVYVSSEGGIVGLRLYVENGKNVPTFHVGWPAVSHGRTMPLVANGVLYFFGSEGIQALRPTDGVRLWQDTAVFSSHWESPIVANGTLYITDETGTLSAYGLRPGDSPTVRFTAKRQGNHVSFRWKLSNGTGVKGFYLYAARTPVVGSLIPTHKSLSYSRTVRWTLKGKLPKFRLQIATTDGIVFSVSAN